MGNRKMRGTGGNQFYSLPMTKEQFADAVLIGCKDLELWCKDTDRFVDYGEITVTTMKVDDGNRVSITVEADLGVRK